MFKKVIYLGLMAGAIHFADAQKINFGKFFVYKGEEKIKGEITMKIKPTNDLLFKKMMTTTGKEYILEDFIEAVTGMKLTNVRLINPY